MLILTKLNSFYPDLTRRIVMGDVRGALARDTINLCEGLIDRYAGKKDRLWILIHSFPELPDKKIIRTKVLISDKKPPRLLGTVCFFVDYTISDVDLLWALPLDIARPPGSVSDEGAGRIVDDAKSLLIIH